MTLRLIFIAIALAFAGCASDRHPVTAAPGASVTNADRLPKVRHIEPPEYPEALKKAGIQGTVLIEFVIASNGSVASAKALESPDSRLAALAEAAALKWTFDPGMKSGTPTGSLMRVPITFTAR